MAHTPTCLLVIILLHICSKCGKTLTIFHVLLECQEEKAQRKKYFSPAYRQHILLHMAMLFDSSAYIGTSDGVLMANVA